MAVEFVTFSTVILFGFDATMEEKVNLVFRPYRARSSEF